MSGPVHDHRTADEDGWWSVAGRWDRAAAPATAARADVAARIS